jgi:hypothetical protein
MSIFDTDDLQFDNTVCKIHATLNHYVRYNDNIKNLQISPEDPSWIIQDKKRVAIESKDNAIVISYNIVTPWTVSREALATQEAINNKFGFDVYCIIYTKEFGYVPMTEGEHNKWSEYFSECVGIAMKERQGVPRLICTLAESFFNSKK